jgi:hypothetical protein
MRGAQVPFVRRGFRPYRISSTSSLQPPDASDPGCEPAVIGVPPLIAERLNELAQAGLSLREVHAEQLPSDLNGYPDQQRKHDPLHIS